MTPQERSALNDLTEDEIEDLYQWFNSSYLPLDYNPKGWTDWHKDFLRASIKDQNIFIKNWRIVPVDTQKVK